MITSTSWGLIITPNEEKRVGNRTNTLQGQGWEELLDEKVPQRDSDVGTCCVEPNPQHKLARDTAPFGPLALQLVARVAACVVLLVLDLKSPCADVYGNTGALWVEVDSARRASVAPYLDVLLARLADPGEMRDERQLMVGVEQSAGRRGRQQRAHRVVVHEARLAMVERAAQLREAKLAFAL
ncbi:hypothetical protein OPV22_000534 [Ensete ventricosum]|uniref:Uncharacterized protein n=1 Tax=Ensete ventricosum TaxID=4639 RepID=A0AAV8RUT7_ENSVE|nr:hypothetical protein OPV22_000534 [Ensete ventricosum]